VIKTLRHAHALRLLGVSNTLVPNDCLRRPRTESDNKESIGGKGRKGVTSSEPAFVNPFQGWMSRCDTTLHSTRVV
jgi:hypothetical protein